MKLRNHDFIKEGARNIVEDFAPEELVLFDELVQEYYNNPSPPIISKEQVDDQLSFGVEDIIETVTPAAIAMVSAAVTYLLTNILKVAQEESTKIVKDRIRQLLIKPNGNEVTLPQEYLEEIRKIAYQQARQFGIEPNKAKKMSYAITGAIILALNK